MRRRSREQQREIAGIVVKPDAEIDLSEMPEVIDWSEAEVGKFYRPPKRPVTMRLDADVIQWLKSYGPGSQTKANMLLHTPCAVPRQQSQGDNGGGRSRLVSEGLGR